MGLGSIFILQYNLILQLTLLTNMKHCFYHIRCKKKKKKDMMHKIVSLGNLLFLDEYTGGNSQSWRRDVLLIGNFFIPCIPRLSTPPAFDAELGD